LRIQQQVKDIWQSGHAGGISVLKGQSSDVKNVKHPVLSTTSTDALIFGKSVRGETIQERHCESGVLGKITREL